MHTFKIELIVSILRNVHTATNANFGILKEVHIRINL